MKIYRFHIFIAVVLLFGCVKKTPQVPVGVSDVPSCQEIKGKEKFRTTVYNYTRTNCVTCHSENQSQRPRHASSNLGEAYLVAKGLINSSEVSSSRLVSYSKNGHCGLQVCTTDGTDISNLVTEWLSEESKSCSVPSATSLPSPTVTFREHVAPILSKRCIQCHEVGGIAPFSLTTYEVAALHKNAIKNAVIARTMPPWGPVGDGSCQKWKDSRFLSDQEIETIRNWVDQGGVEGNRTLPLPTPVPISTLEGANIRLKMKAPYDARRRDGVDDFRCFEANIELISSVPPILPNIYLTAHEVVPGKKEIVHHVVFMATTQTRSIVDPLIAQKEMEDPEPGWSCFGGSGLNTETSTLGVWTPGEGPVLFPRDTGIQVPSEARIIIQIHYSLSDFPPETLTVRDPGTEIRVKIENQRPGLKNAAMLVAGISDFSIPPRQSLFPIYSEKTVSEFLNVEGDHSGKIYGIFPHSHRTGKTITLHREIDGQNSCLVNVPDWNFNWQGFYFYESPITVTTSEKWKLKCEYNTSLKTTTTHSGEETDDEMCLVVLYVTAD